jgi:hypothetical protein
MEAREEVMEVMVLIVQEMGERVELGRELGEEARKE